MKWPWQPNLPPLTEKQRAHVDEVATAQIRNYLTDWGHLVEALAKAAHISRDRALLFLCVNQIGIYGEAIARAAHPEFSEKCGHCQNQRLMAEYMRETLKIVKRENKDHEDDNDWKPE